VLAELGYNKDGLYTSAGGRMGAEEATATGEVMLGEV
jgi:hypothetical protein